MHQDIGILIEKLFDRGLTDDEQLALRRWIDAGEAHADFFVLYRLIDSELNRLFDDDLEAMNRGA